MAFRWYVDDGPTLNAGLVAAICQRIQTCITRKSYIFVIFQRGGAFGPTVSPPPSEPAHGLISLSFPPDESLGPMLPIERE